MYVIALAIFAGLIIGNGQGLYQFAFLDKYNAEVAMPAVGGTILIVCQGTVIDPSFAPVGKLAWGYPKEFVVVDVNETMLFGKYYCLGQAGELNIQHRFCSDQEQLKFLKDNACRDPREYCVVSKDGILPCPVKFPETECPKASQNHTHYCVQEQPNAPAVTRFESYGPCAIVGERKNVRNLIRLAAIGGTWDKCYPTIDNISAIVVAGVKQLFNDYFAVHSTENVFHVYRSSRVRVVEECLLIKIGGRAAWIYQPGFSNSNVTILLYPGGRDATSLPNPDAMTIPNGVFNKGPSVNTIECKVVMKSVQPAYEDIDIVKIEYFTANYVVVFGGNATINATPSTNYPETFETLRCQLVPPVPTEFQFKFQISFLWTEKSTSKEVANTSELSTLTMNETYQCRCKLVFETATPFRTFEHNYDTEDFYVPFVATTTSTTTTTTTTTTSTTTAATESTTPTAAAQKLGSDSLVIIIEMAFGILCAIQGGAVG